MTGDTDFEAGRSSDPVRGELRRLPPGPTIRLLQALTMITLVRGLWTAILRYALGHRHRFELSLGARELVLEHEHALLGTRVRNARTLLPLSGLREITLEKGGEPPHFTVGIAALSLGTFLGFRLLAEGFLTAGGAPWLFGLGALFILSGVLLDFFVGSGRTPKSTVGRPEITLRVAGGRGWVLTGLGVETATRLLDRIEAALSTPPAAPPQEVPGADSEEPLATDPAEQEEPGPESTSPSS